MRTIIFLHTTKSGSSREAIKAAEKLGYFTVLLTNSKNFIKQRVNFPDVHKMILVDLTNLQEIKETIESNQRQGLIIEGIVSFVDPFVSLAVELHEEYCNGCLSINAIKAMEDKTLTRELLKGMVPRPTFVELVLWCDTDFLSIFKGRPNDSAPLSFSFNYYVVNFKTDLIF
ncbi:hypothetical protein QUF56_10885 [Ureibacillus composti]|nr:hypothetical protein [Ureibacillus composti]